MQQYLNFSEQAHKFIKHGLTQYEIQILDLMAKAQFLRNQLLLGI